MSEILYHLGLSAQVCVWVYVCASVEAEGTKGRNGMVFGDITEQFHRGNESVQGIN